MKTIGIILLVLNFVFGIIGLIVGLSTWPLSFLAATACGVTLKLRYFS